MDISSRLDSEYLAAQNLLPEGLLDFADLSESRKRKKDRRTSAPKPAMPPSVSIIDHFVEGIDGHSVTVRVYTPEAQRRNSPAFYWVHGGRLVLGDVPSNDPWCAEAAHELNVVVASVEYRLAPEFPYPIPLEDCYTGLTWLFQRAANFGIDSSKIAIGGNSAGGGLAAGLAMPAALDRFLNA